MATQGQGAATSPPANVVGNAFVSQYYNVLHVSPQVVHRFYTDASCLTRAEAGPEGPAETLISQGEIHNKIVSLDFEGCKSEIKTVDSQKSLSGSVLVMVTGAIYKNGGKRNFLQTFFLAPQEKGFYVHNDIFRYLDEEIPQLPQAMEDVSVEDNNIPEAQIEHEVRDLSPPTPIEEEAIVEDDFEAVESTNPPQQAEVVILEEVVDLDAVNELLPSEVVPEVPAALVEEMPAEKKSYASIVRVASSNNTKPPATKIAATTTPPVPPPPTTSEQPGISRSMPPPTIEAPAAADSDVQNESKIMEQEADGRSVYVRNLPTDILADQLKDVFMKFGTIRPNGVQVRSNKLGGCYGFVEFEDTNSAHSAIEVSPIMIGSRPAFIEEKRSTTVVSGRGRGGLQGRGGGLFRNDTGRGRAFYGRGGGQDYGRGGGRGYARGANQDYGRGGSRGGFARGAGQEYARGRGGYRGGAYGKFGSNPNSNGAESYRRTDAYSGNGTSSSALPAFATA